MGLPIHRVLSGTDSPLITSDTGPTVACSPSTAAGRMTLFGPERRPRPQRHGVHAEHAVMEQVRLHDAAAVDGRAVAQLDQVGLGQPVGLAPDALADCGAHRPQPDVERPASRSRRARTTERRRPRRRCPRARCARRTAPQRVLGARQAADQQPLRQRGHAGRDRAGDDQHHARRASGRHPPAGLVGKRPRAPPRRRARSRPRPSRGSSRQQPRPARGPPAAACAGW